MKIGKLHGTQALKPSACALVTQPLPPALPSPLLQASPEPATAANPIVRPLEGTPGKASTPLAQCTEDAEAQQAAAEAAAATPPAPARRRLRSLVATLRRSSSQLAQALRSRLAAAPAQPAAVCSGCPGRRLGCGQAAAGGWTSTYVNWTAVPVSA